MLQFLREYTGKVDELVKDKLEAQNEVKAKEQEEKDVIAQQVGFLAHLISEFFAFWENNCFELYLPYYHHEITGVLFLIN